MQRGPCWCQLAQDQGPAGLQFLLNRKDGALTLYLTPRGWAPSHRPPAVTPWDMGGKVKFLEMVPCSSCGFHKLQEVLNSGPYALDTRVLAPVGRWHRCVDSSLQGREALSDPSPLAANNKPSHSQWWGGWEQFHSQWGGAVQGSAILHHPWHPSTTSITTGHWSRNLTGGRPCRWSKEGRKEAMQSPFVDSVP